MSPSSSQTVAKTTDYPTDFPVNFPITPIALETSNEIHKAVWKLAWPSVITMLLHTLNGLMDMAFVGHLHNSKQALAATGVGGGFMFILISLAMGVTVGTTALVARFTGARDPENAVLATSQSLSLGLALSLIFGTIAYVGRDFVIDGMLSAKNSPEAFHLCSQFLGIILLGTVPLFLMNVLQSALRGVGDAKTPMYVTIATVIVHTILNILLINGYYGFPRLEVRGAAFAFLTSLFVGTIWYFVVVWRHPQLKSALQIKHLKPTWEWFSRILTIGIPASIQALTRSVSMMLFTGMLARTPEAAAAVAALQLGMRIEGLAFMPGFGYGIAASTLVGQSLGAKNPHRAERCAWSAVTQSVAVMSAVALIFFLFAPQIAGIFTDDAQVKALGVQFLRLNAIFEPCLAIAMVLTNALQGAGETIRPTYITILTMVVIRLPLATFLMFTLQMHTKGAWLSMGITTLVGAIMTTILFRSNTWKEKQIR